MYGSIHTHVESDKDTMNLIPDAISEFRKAGIKKIAITEHGSMASYEDLRAEAKKYDDIDVIPGCEIYFDYYKSILEKVIANNNLDIPEEDKDALIEIAKKDNHMILFAKNINGYKQLCKIVTESNKNVINNKPIVTLDILKKYAKSTDLVCSSACIGGPFGHLLGLDKYDLQTKLDNAKAVLDATDFFEHREKINRISTLVNNLKEENIDLQSQIKLELKKPKADKDLEKIKTLRATLADNKDTIKNAKILLKDSEFYIKSNGLTRSGTTYTNNLKKYEFLDKYQNVNNLVAIE